jgi:hypothetical protein
MPIITPYDGKIALWLVHGDDVGEASIDEIAQTILTYAPAVNAVWVKTNDGADWMSKYDTKPALWIDGPAAIDRWVATLQRYGLEFHAWCVPRGLDIDAETSVMLQVCQRPGVRSMVMDVEPYNGFWAGGQAAIRPYMLKLRSVLPGTFHIGMSVDSRQAHYSEIYPLEWYPFVNSVHPQVYWPDFGNTPEQALTEAYAAWGQYGRPIFPVLSGFNAPPAELNTARTLAISQHQAAGLSWWAFGHIDAAHFVSINHFVNGAVATSPPGADGSPTQTGTPTVITVSSGQYHDGTYNANTPFSTYQGPNGLGKFRPTDQNVANVYAAWDPQIKQAGWYRVEAFVPAQHATSGNARYKIHGVVNRPDEYIVSATQASLSNDWLTLGTFQIDPSRTQSGVVYLDDWTLEVSREVAFDALRWLPIGTLPPGVHVQLNVPYRSQEDPDARRFRNDCGPACVAMYIDWQRQQNGSQPQPVSIDMLASQTALANSDTGLTTSALVTLATRYNVKLTLTDNLGLADIVSELNAGRPPLALIGYGPLLGRENQGDSSGHFVIITGYDANNLYLNDPDWWNQGTHHREDGHNWQVPITQFNLAMAQSPVPHQGLMFVS